MIHRVLEWRFKRKYEVGRFEDFTGFLRKWRVEEGSHLEKELSSSFFRLCENVEKWFAETELDVSDENVLAVEIHQVSRTSSDISFDLELIGLTELPDLMRKAPYLVYRGDNTKMRVLWQLILTDTCTIEWGTDTSYSLGSQQTTEFGTDHQHRYTIGLKSTLRILLTLMKRLCSILYYLSGINMAYQSLLIIAITPRLKNYLMASRHRLILANII